MPIHQDVSTRYASDLNDQEFELIVLHSAQKDASGKKQTVDIRDILNAIFYRSVHQLRRRSDCRCVFGGSQVVQRCSRSRSRCMACSTASLTMAMSSRVVPPSSSAPAWRRCSAS